ncbi:HEAT repeat protein [Cordyceps fumosorosea ARSEF 2679]|uniref:HEAT repeat protein n=1 Tax=Cordyceps fumosorosea (strain ARSEF 2679) TaxID=1081104 RepID=A0A162N1Q7_CORFA|nr:HEAT repeat protein [Cordyceps fumosorosea ARSEF 2679]OAA74099.1 HEAT repeat protein [Cordyceps fumosorosea ARSEF 2679]
MAAQQDLLDQGVLSNAGQLIRFLESQQQELQHELAASAFERLYSEAAQPRSVSGDACVRLCGLVEQASKCASPDLRCWAFSHDVVLRLFNFYIEWNEYDHHRSMRLVLDLVASLLRKNPDPHAAARSRAALLDDLVSIVARRSTKPVAKSAIKTLDHLLGKHVFTLDDLRASYEGCRGDARGRTPMEVWGVLVEDLFDWMCRHFVCPAAGKMIVTLYRMLRQGKAGADQIPSIHLWHSWLLEFVTKEPSLVERIKNYVFLPLFKIDRKEALLFLQKMNNDRLVSASEKLHVDIPALIHLAALETGKRVGLVEEPDLDSDSQAQTDGGSIVLQEEVLESVLGHPSHEVRSLVFSILISSPSTTKPYSPRALQLLQKHLGAFFADPDAKFRVDVSARARDMFKRVRGAISVLKRSIPRVRAKAAKEKKREAATEAPAPAMYRTNLITLPEESLVQCLTYHEEFLKWYLEFLCEELVPTASYQRHIASLKALGHILRMEGEKGKAWETADDQTLLFDVFDGKWIRALFDLLMDPFEDVREVTSTVLKFIFADARYRRFSLRAADAESSTQDAAADLCELSRRANDLARRTARADHADGAARVNQLLYRFLDTPAERIALLSGMIDELERKIALAEADLGRAVLEAPVHGDFASLCGMWQVVSELPLDDAGMHEVVGALQARLLECCRRAWVSVKYILCDDSPEGHLPSELEELEGLDTKGLISYSFRSIHESSNLMRIMVLAVRNKSRKGAVTPSKDVYLGIGRLTFEQLCSLRHRGAFTNVSATFAACCQQSKHLERADGDEDMLLTWYHGAMDAINSQVSTTRRSAGIPSLITGILSANAVNPSFDSVMETLIKIAGTEAQVTEIDDTQLPQVHAYNCLKDIFKSSVLTALGNKSEAYLPRCLELAAGGLRSEVWAVRNCGLIFLRSLIDCLFGSHESKQMIEAGWDGQANRIPYHRYPNLPEVLRGLLRSGHGVMAVTSPLSAAAAESVFPALDIIRRAGPPALLRDEIQGDVAHYLSSSVWHVREMAARTLCSCLLHDQWLGTIKQVYGQAQSASGGMRLNYIHGVLLTLKFVFERLSEVSLDQLKPDLPELVDFLSSCNIATDYANCPDVVAAFLEVLNQTWALQLAEGLPLKPSTPPLSEKSNLALFKSQKVINDVFLAHQSSDPISALRDIIFNPHAGVNTLVTALEAIPKLWSPASTSEQTLLSLCLLYSDAALRTTYLEAQTAAVENLADVLDALLPGGGETPGLPLDELASLWACLPLGPMNPALSNAAIRAGGSIVAALRVAGRLTPEGLSSWAVLMADAGLDDKTFDTRFAAAEAFRSFFTVVGPRCEAPEFLPVLLALYDALNDDDEEVRDLGSAAFSRVAGVALVPVEAAEWLLRWLVATFRPLPAFRAAVATRFVRGSGASAEQQLAEALRVDDALFAVEEQNLFVDEVREARRWTAAFDGLRPWGGVEDGAALAALDAWVRGGVGGLRRVVEGREDGPLGWASDARVFAVATRIVYGFLALAGSGAASEGLLAEVAALKQAARGKENVVSRLLMDALDKIM